MKNLGKNLGKGMARGLKQSKEKKKATQARIALLNSLGHINADFYSSQSLYVQKQYMTFKDPFEKDIGPNYNIDKEAYLAQVSASKTKACAADLKPTYDDQLVVLWDNLNSKVIEKMSDSRKLLCEEVRQIQGRHRQFFKIQLRKHQMDKFEPAKEAKIALELEQQQMLRKKKGGKAKSG